MTQKFAGANSTIGTLMVITSVQPDGSTLEPLDGRPLRVEIFGGKAWRLSKVAKAGANIAFGYALSTEMLKDVRYNRATAETWSLLRTAFDLIKNKSPLRQVVVRSSGWLEDGSNSKLSGFYPTILGIKNFESFVAALKSCSVSADRNQRLGEEEFEASQDIPLLFQAQIDCTNSALVLLSRTMVRVELYRGNLDGPIAGNGTPTVVLGFRDGTKPLCNLNLLKLDTDDQGLSEKSLVLARSALAALPQVSDNALFEMGETDNKWFIFQEQQLSSALSEQFVHRLFLSPAIGKKAAAMMYFKDRGLFGKKLMILPSGENPDEQASSALRSWDAPITLRFSKDAELGLPRFFAQTKEEVVDKIRKRDLGSIAIVHEFVRVVRSFEILIERGRLYLEHVPGLWESQNKLPPDALIIDANGQCRAFRYNSERLTISGKTPGYDQLIENPVQPSDIVRWAERLSKIAKILRNDFLKEMPLNFHFVEDERGDWAFLNVRAGFSPSLLTEFDRHGTHKVTCVEDLETWDKRTPILLYATTDRGQEHSLLPLALALKNLEVPIYAAFGILSHPAMVLQAHGVKLSPAYFQACDRQKCRYEEFNFSLDQKTDPLVRISHEPAIYADDVVRIVADREPIVPGHWLAVATQPMAGFADDPNLARALLAAVRDLPVQNVSYSNNWLLYERGRAQFCTSGFTGVFAHAHILPLSAFPSGSLAGLADITAAERFCSLEEAWLAAKSVKGEYLVFGNDTEGYMSAKLPQDAEKRYVRKFFTGLRE